MLLVIDNYDSFTYNLVQYLGELGADIEVRRNDAITVDEIKHTLGYSVKRFFNTVEAKLGDRDMGDLAGVIFFYRNAHAEQRRSVR